MILHHIWLGPPCPIHMQKWIQQWRIAHPGWRHILWDEDAIEKFGLRNADAFAAAPNFGEKSDIARYEILHRLGCVLSVHPPCVLMWIARLCLSVCLSNHRHSIGCSGVYILMLTWSVYKAWPHYTQHGDVNSTPGCQTRGL